VFDVNAQGYTNGFTGLDNEYSYVSGVPSGTGNLAQLSYPIGISASAGSGPLATASLSGGVAVGSIALDADATGMQDPRGPGYGGGVGSVSTSLSWDDTLTLDSSLPSGTPVSLLFTLSLSGNLGVQSVYPDSADIVASLSVALPGVNPLVVKGGVLQGALFGSTTGFPGGSYVIAASSSVGSSFGISGAVQSYVTANPSGAAAAHSWLNAIADVDVTSLTPGVYIASGSGVSYAAPVPLPPALPQLALGIVAIWCRGRRRVA
jgi:hypothetical protein